MTETKAWYLSRTVWASLVGILISLGALLGYSVEQFDGESLIDGMLQAATAIAGVFALLGRLAATRRIG